MNPADHPIRPTNVILHHHCTTCGGTHHVPLELAYDHYDTEHEVHLWRTAPHQYHPADHITVGTLPAHAAIIVPFLNRQQEDK